MSNFPIFPPTDWPLKSDYSSLGNIENNLVNSVLYHPFAWVFKRTESYINNTMEQEKNFIISSCD